MSCFLMILPNSLQYTLKRVGPKTDPCGTPYLTRLQQERELFTFTEVVRSTRYDRNHSKALSLTPMSRDAESGFHVVKYQKLISGPVGRAQRHDFGSVTGICH